MSKRLIVVLALALVVGLAFSAAYAEVQNVKVSGDIIASGVLRSHFNLTQGAGDKGVLKQNFLMTQTRVRVDADLTDNVSTTIRLINERSWGDEFNPMDEVMLGFGDDLFSDGYYGYFNSPIELDLAYVTLKEFLYSPLTLTLGRQELRFGNGLVIGDVDTNMLSNSFGVPMDLSLKKAFDAIRATLDYSPWVIDLVYSKIAEHDLFWATNLYGPYPEKNDTDLWGINANWDMKALGIEGKTDFYLWTRKNLYLWSDTDDDGFAGAKKDVCNTIGFLTSGKILKNLTGSFEYAYQFGTLTTDPQDGNSNNAKRRAFALQAALNYMIQAEKIKDKAPMIGIEYTYLSGDNDSNLRATQWDPMFEDQTPNNIVNAILPNTGVQHINLLGSMKPTEDVTLAANYGYYWLTKKPGDDHFDIPSPYAYDGRFGGFGYNSGKIGLGNALDLTATYDYTEDVQFGLTVGMFAPGPALRKAVSGYHNSGQGYDEIATQLVGSMKVTF